MPTPSASRSGSATKRKLIQHMDSIPLPPALMRPLHIITRGDGQHMSRITKVKQEHSGLPLIFQDTLASSAELHLRRRVSQLRAERTHGIKICWSQTTKPKSPDTADTSSKKRRVDPPRPVISWKRARSDAFTNSLWNDMSMEFCRWAKKLERCTGWESVVHICIQARALRPL